jgi:hypothetical protein
MYSVGRELRRMFKQRRKWTASSADSVQIFGHSVSAFRICQSMWCGSCYTSKDHPEFFIAVGDHFQAEADDEDRIRCQGRLREGRTSTGSG